MFRITNYERATIDFIAKKLEPSDVCIFDDSCCFLATFDLTIPEWDVTFVGICWWKRHKHQPGSATYFTFCSVYSPYPISCFVKKHSNNNMGAFDESSEVLDVAGTQIRFNSPEKERVFFSELTKEVELAEKAYLKEGQSE